MTHHTMSECFYHGATSHDIKKEREREREGEIMIQGNMCKLRGKNT